MKIAAGGGMNEIATITTEFGRQGGGQKVARPTLAFALQSSTAA